MNPILAGIVNMASRRLATLAMWGYYMAAYKPDPVQSICATVLALGALAAFTFKSDSDKPTTPPAA
jgi:hypothetical protein